MPYNKCHTGCQCVDFAEVLVSVVLVANVTDSNGESDASLMIINWTEVSVLGAWWRVKYEKSKGRHRITSETEEPSRSDCQWLSLSNAVHPNS